MGSTARVAFLAASVSEFVSCEGLGVLLNLNASKKVSKYS